MENDTYFGLTVTGWAGAAGEHYHNQCLPEQSVKDGDVLVTPIWPDEAYDYQPRCTVCKLPVLVTLSPSGLDTAESAALEYVLG